MLDPSLSIRMCIASRSAKNHVLSSGGATLEQAAERQYLCFTFMPWVVARKALARLPAIHIPPLPDLKYFSSIEKPFGLQRPLFAVP